MTKRLYECDAFYIEESMHGPEQIFLYRKQRNKIGWAGYGVGYQLMRVDLTLAKPSQWKKGFELSQAERRALERFTRSEIII
jgi:hypothetical protein